MLPLAVPFLLKDPWDLLLMLNTGRPESVLGSSLCRALAALDLLAPLAAGRYILRGAEAAGQPLPDVTVRASAGPALLGIDGMIGLDFLEQFAEVRLRTDALLLTPVARS